MKNKIIVMMSGGLDSTVLFYFLQKEEHENIIPLFINYGQLTAEKELSAIHKVLPSKIKEKLKIINIESVYSDTDSPLIVERNLWKDKVEDEDLYLPYRNLVLFSVAVAYAQTVEIDKIYAGFINTYFAKEIDSSVDFLNSLKNLTDNINNVKIILPFEKMSKKEVVKLGLKLRVPITQTYSCQVNSSTPCGACPNCVERLEALDKYEKQ